MQKFEHISSCNNKLHMKQILIAACSSLSASLNMFHFSIFLHILNSLYKMVIKKMKNKNWTKDIYKKNCKTFLDQHTNPQSYHHSKIVKHSMKLNDKIQSKQKEIMSKELKLV